MGLFLHQDLNSFNLKNITLMKKTILLLAVILTSTVAVLAQTVSGTKVLGGGISYISEKQPEYLEFSDNSSSLSIMPSFGVFVADQIAVGVNVAFESSKTESFGTESKQSAFGVGPFARYYAHTSNENFAFFAQASVLFMFGKDTNTADVETKNSAIDISVSPGFAYFFNEHWSAELWLRGIAYTAEDPNKDADDDKISSFQIGLNSLYPSIGIRYYF
jgi:hypothetical protein